MLEVARSNIAGYITPKVTEIVYELFCSYVLSCHAVIIVIQYEIHLNSENETQAVIQLGSIYFIANKHEHGIGSFIVLCFEFVVFYFVQLFCHVPQYHPLDV